VRTVTAGQAVGDLTVIEHGVEPGEHVVVDGQSRLVPGAKVDAKVQATPVAQRSGGSGIDE
jgi:multidrug efflux pump subunit AcrA (membrane-fusion protein)